MDDFQKKEARLRKNPAFGIAFDKRRAKAEVAFQIRRLREDRGWTQRELARQVGCTQQAISAIEQAGYTRHSLPLLRLGSRRRYGRPAPRARGESPRS